MAPASPAALRADGVSPGGATERAAGAGEPDAWGLEPSAARDDGDGAAGASLARREALDVTPSAQYREVEAPAAAMLRRALAPPSPTLPRRPAAASARERMVKSYGVIAARGGGVYEGQLLAGRPHGAGTLRVPDGRGAGGTRLAYDGEWARGRRHGCGAEHCRTGEVYVGEFRNGVRNGIGRMSYLCGAVYDGGWVAGRREGGGTLRLASGDLFKGCWADEKREGPGAYYWLSRGQKYVGEWAGDCLSCGTVVPIPFDELEALLQEAAVAEAASLAPGRSRGASDGDAGAPEALDDTIDGGSAAVEISEDALSSKAAATVRRRDALPRLKLAAPSGVVYAQVERIRAVRSAKAERAIRRREVAKANAAARAARPGTSAAVAGAASLGVSAHAPRCRTAFSGTLWAEGAGLSINGISMPATPARSAAPFSTSLGATGRSFAAGTGDAATSGGGGRVTGTASSGEMELDTGGMPDSALKRLRHAFLAMARPGTAELRVSEIPALLVLSGLDPTAAATGLLDGALRKAARGTGMLSFDRFLAAITWYT